MPSDTVRILFLADSHLGFDLPMRPRSTRRRRGHDFLANHAAALEPALAGAVDLVVHGGDVFDRPDVHETLAWQALRPLVRVAETGVPVFVVPGNHERARLPHARLAEHPRVHVFDRPRTFVIDVRGIRVALSGFPYERRVRSRFRDVVERTGWRQHDARLHLLCMHQCAEGAIVGPGDFMFTTAPDVIRSSDVPTSFDAVLSGHIHRHQVLTTDLGGRPLDVPVLYPGSIERTSFAEIDEAKGYMIVDLCTNADGCRVREEFRPLPARPMVAKEVSVTGLGGRALDRALRSIVAAAPTDAVLRIRIAGDVTTDHMRVLRAAHVRTFTPDTMNLEIRPRDGAPFVAPAIAGRRRTQHDAGESQSARGSGVQLDLGIAH